MADNTQIVLQRNEIVPEINPKNHAVANELWQSLSSEVEIISEEIRSGKELEPQDVKKVQSLRKQVDDYVKAFNRAMKETQQQYKSAVEERLDQLGYTVIENYVQEQRQKQTDIQNERSSDKMNILTKIVTQQIADTTAVKNTVLAGELFPAFYDRFPIIKSGAESKMIDDWTPYEQVVEQNLKIVDTFLQDDKYRIAQKLPISSQTIQQLLQYIRTGDIDKLANMKDIFKKDRSILEDMVLRENIKTQMDAINMIKGMVPGEEGKTEETLINISKVVSIALTLQ